FQLTFFNGTGNNPRKLTAFFQMLIFRNELVAVCKANDRSSGSLQFKYGAGSQPTTIGESRSIGISKNIKLAIKHTNGESPSSPNSGTSSMLKLSKWSRSSLLISSPSVSSNNGSISGYIVIVMAISVISVSSDSSEESVGTSIGRVILFSTIPTTIPNTTPFVIPPSTHIDTALTPTSPDYTPASPDYSPTSDTEFDLSEDPSSDHIPPLPANSPFLSSTDDSSGSDIPDTSPSPTHGIPFTETTLATQRSPTTSGALRRRVMILTPGQPIPHGRPYRYYPNGPVRMITARKRVGPLPTHVLRFIRGECGDIYWTINLFGTIPTTIPNTTPFVIPPSTHNDTALTPTSPDYTPASPDYSSTSDTEFDPSEDPSSYHIPPLPATSPFLSSTDDSAGSDIPDTPPSPTHGTPFTETTLSTQRSPTTSGAL
nr:hypothetical protein [Tanacetum cinerariifolium]